MSINITLPQIPGANSVLIAVVAITDSGLLGEVTSISQTGAVWQRAIRAGDGSERAEIWWAADVSGADVDLTINTSGDQSEAAIVAEYSGLTTFLGTIVDQTATDTGNSATAGTGTTPTTTNKNELFVASFAIRGGSVVSAPTNSFTLEEQLSTGAGGTNVTSALSTREVSVLSALSTEVTIDSGIVDWAGAMGALFGNLLSVDTVAPDIIQADGGTKLTLTGKFDVLRTYKAHIGPVGDDTDPTGYLPSGNVATISPKSATSLEVYSPELLAEAGNLVNIHVEENNNPTQTDDLLSSLALVDPDLKSLAFQMRALFPPKYRVGPRDFSVLAAPKHVQNLVLFSEAFDNAAWAKTNLTVITGQADPFGGVLGFTLHEDTSAGNHQIAQTGIAVTAADTFIFTVYAKRDNRTFMGLRIDPDVGGPIDVFYNLLLGTVLTVDAGGVGRIRTIGADGFFRCQVAVNFPATVSSVDLTIAIAEADDDVGFTGIDQDSVTIAFAHFDVWSVERAYVKTESTPVTP